MEFRAGGVYSYRDSNDNERLWLALYVEYIGKYQHVGYTDEMDPFYEVTDTKGNKYKISINPLSKKTSSELPNNARLLGMVNAYELSKYEKAFSDNHKRRFKL